MTYKYYSTNSDVTKTPQKRFTDNFQAMMDADFSTSQDVYTVLEETSFASGSYVNTDVRINNAISAETGLKLGNDFRRLLFKDIDHDVSMGSKFYLDDNCYWITTNIESTNNLAIACTIRRCNNYLRWVDSEGETYSEPVAIEYVINRSIDQTSTKDPTLPSGYIDVYSQLNDNTREIRVGSRFLFGNSDHWTAYSCYGNGIRNFLNSTTGDNDSAKLLKLQLGIGFVNEDTDDLVNGYADRYKNVYTLSPYPSSISGSIGNIFQIDPNVEINDINVTKDMLYTSSDTDIVTVSGSGGLVTLVNNGSAIISMNVVTNTSASANINVGVSASSVDYEIRINPNSGSILESETQIYEVYSYSGGVVQSDAFVFSVSGSLVPVDHYLLTTIDNNNFSVKNVEKYMHDSLKVDSTSGSNVRQIEISLNGAW